MSPLAASYHDGQDRWYGKALQLPFKQSYNTTSWIVIANRSREACRDNERELLTTTLPVRDVAVLHLCDGDWREIFCV